MTDEQIKKALEEYLQKCQNIKYGARQKILVDADFLKDVLNFINRQKAEMERLQKSGEEAVSCFTQMESLYKIKCKELEVAKSEAIKKFWNCRPERLNEHLEGKEEYNKGWNACLHEFYETKKDLVKEMVGE